ncbi:MAG TPA: RsmG family class I SAM-dependent methyltransferase [Vicinamibacterales bacterium]|nr:RsmG family class I SAM-dependent methyltransferase [Vicinamibacterales bacterium]
MSKGSQKPFTRLLSERAEAAGIALNSAQCAALETYFALLKRWNSRINLTALPVDDATDATIDRLFIEPLVAAQALGDHYRNWFDLGSGGGSPAIPMKTSWPQTRLTMVESKSRKTAFLREAIREVALPRAFVLEDRFEDLARTNGAMSSADLVTVRAVRLDAGLLVAAYSLLKAGGCFAVFSSKGQELFASGSVKTAELMTAHQELTGKSLENAGGQLLWGRETHALPGESILCVLRKPNL